MKIYIIRAYANTCVIKYAFKTRKEAEWYIKQNFLHDAKIQKLELKEGDVNVI